MIYGTGRIARIPVQADSSFRNSIRMKNTDDSDHEESNADSQAYAQKQEKARVHDYAAFACAGVAGGAAWRR